jgi:molybdenum cofactor guanylyltransferase
MTRQQDALSAFVLCGGKSLRAGFDKQTLQLNGKLIAEWIADELSETFSEITLVTNQPQLYRSSRYRVVEDLIPDRGPLGGIHAGLANSTGEFAFVTACDMPNISQAYLRFLKEEVAQEKNAFDAVAVRLDNGMLEPMSALYAKRTLPLIEEMLQNNERKAADLLLRVNTRYVSESEILPYGGREYLFFNMNTPDEIRAYFDRKEALK